MVTGSGNFCGWSSVRPTFTVTLQAPSRPGTIRPCRYLFCRCGGLVMTHSCTPAGIDPTTFPVRVCRRPPYVVTTRSASGCRPSTDRPATVTGTAAGAGRDAGSGGQEATGVGFGLIAATVGVTGDGDDFPPPHPDKDATHAMEMTASMEN
ncbi:hypothetical protein FRACA_410028 [Frankia canadensis]|uniref:Uncharacterized protein n=1 Tax=Frankia canadensis TaxID=1836972 RepID=A0A2I2KWW8_9ACTN|nr:hypothetical protein FRACA_410028 [Frankia canadensis]SOU57444.1 hypothetical protein FRACA_410028 [Frankia canadensis]